MLQSLKIFTKFTLIIILKYKEIIMAYWVWDPSFSVGIEIIDNQHKRIIEYINELGVASQYGDQQKVYNVLLGLIDYTISHFSFEESLQEQAGYPMLEPHKKVHQAFIRRIEFFKERYEGGEDVTKQLMSELQIWLINHIQHDDSDYTDDVKAMLDKKKHGASEQEEQKGWLSSMVNKFFK